MASVSTSGAGDKGLTSEQAKLLRKERRKEKVSQKQSTAEQAG